MKSFDGTIYDNKLHGWEIDMPIKDFGKDLVKTAHEIGEFEVAEIFDYLLTRVEIAEKNTSEFFYQAESEILKEETK